MHMKDIMDFIPDNLGKSEEPAENLAELKSSKRIKWIMFSSRVLEDQFILIYDKEDLQEAKKEYPNLAIYFPHEIEDLLDKSDDIDAIKIIHAIKKMGGWILSCDSLLYKRWAEL